MNWLDRARREIRREAEGGTAKTAEGNPMAVTSVPHPPLGPDRPASIGSNGSLLPEDLAALRDEYEERAAIMQFEGGLSREEAGRAAWALVYGQGRLH